MGTLPRRTEALIVIDHGCIIDYTMLYVGTSGFSYDDWVSPLYPAALPKRDEDSHERHDYTYRREDTIRQIKLMPD